MRVEERFNRRSAELIEAQQPLVDSGFALGVRARFFTMPGSDDGRTLSVHMTPDEALAFARDLIEAARRRIKA